MFTYWLKYYTYHTWWYEPGVFAPSHPAFKRYTVPGILTKYQIFFANQNVRISRAFYFGYHMAQSWNRFISSTYFPSGPNNQAVVFINLVYFIRYTFLMSLYADIHLYCYLKTPKYFKMSSLIKGFGSIRKWLCEN